LILFPAIDLKDGQCVRLFKGRFTEKIVYSRDPAAMAEHWAEVGAEWLHLVDLDGSLGNNQANRRVLEAISKRVKLKLQLGGGIRTREAADRWFDLGLDRLILGTVVCEDPGLAADIATRYPGRLAVALDAVDEEVRVRGWQESGGVNLFEMAARLGGIGATLVIYTDVDRDGTQDGPNVENTRKVAQVSGLPTLCSGGVSGLDDLVAVKALEPFGVTGVISGKALYEGVLDFAEGQRFLKT